MLLYIFWLIVAVALGVAAVQLLQGLARRMTPRVHRPLLRLGLKYGLLPTQLLIPVFAAKVVTDAYSDVSINQAAEHILALVAIGGIARLLIGAVSLLRDLIMSRHDVTAEDNLLARKISTQLRVIQRIIVV